MASVSIKEAREALDVARFVGDTKRIAAAKAVLAQLVATHKTTEARPDTEIQWQLAAD